MIDSECGFNMKSILKLISKILLIILIVCPNLIGCTPGCAKIKKSASPVEVDPCKEAEKAWSIFFEKYPDDGKKKTQQQIDQELRTEEWIRASEWDQACETEKANHEKKEDE